MNVAIVAEAANARPPGPLAGAGDVDETCEASSLLVKEAPALRALACPASIYRVHDDCGTWSAIGALIVALRSPARILCDTASPAASRLGVLLTTLATRGPPPRAFAADMRLR